MINVTAECPLCRNTDEFEINELEVDIYASGHYIDEFDVWICDDCWEAACAAVTVTRLWKHPDGSRTVVHADDAGAMLNAFGHEYGAASDVDTLMSATIDDPESIIIAQLACDSSRHIAIRLEYPED